MDIVFVLLGISLYFASAAVFTLDYYKKNPRLAIASFALPPIAWRLYRQDWQKSQYAAYAQLVGIALIAIGFTLINVFSPLKEPQKSRHKTFESAIYGDYVKSDQAIRDNLQAEKNSPELNGRLHGQSFSYTRAEFDHNGVLRISQGDDFQPELEISIVFPQKPKLAKGRWKRTVRPHDTYAPSIYLSWLGEEGRVLHAQKFNGGYSMDLMIKPEQFNRYTASLNLVLPDHEKSYAVGQLIIHSSRLRFTFDGLDTFHDSEETIEFIASENLRNTYGSYIKDIYGFQDTDISYRSGNGLASTTVFLNMSAGGVKTLFMQFYKNSTGWYPDVKGIKDKLKEAVTVSVNVPNHLRLPLNTRKSAPSVASTQPIKSTEMPPASKQGAPLKVSALSEKLGTMPSSEEARDEVKQSNNTRAVKEPLAAPLKAKVDAEISIDITRDVSLIAARLKPFVNKKINVLTHAGKVKTGHYVRIQRKQIVVEIELATGVIEYLTAFDKLKSIELVDHVDTRPRKATFFKPEKTSVR